MRFLSHLNHVWIKKNVAFRNGLVSRKITNDIDAVILGMHAKADNPELLKAQELGLKIYSYPEFLYEQSKSKTRVVIGGSHGKTTTSMVLHVMHYNDIAVDYMVGAQLDGFDTMVHLQMRMTLSF
jgi:UDP-N-acetylmuramate: L-alanyl-gamma-D-glutamyl-meso-diaminopimelate ligase